MNNIAGQRDIGLLPHKVTSNLGAAGPERADVDFSGFPVHCSAEPVRREIGVYVQLGKAFDIPVGNQEQVTYHDLDFHRPTQRALWRTMRLTTFSKAYEFIRPRLNALAGLWSVWEDRGGNRIPLCAIITTTGNDLLRPGTCPGCRMILPEDTEDFWLDRTIDDPGGSHTLTN